MPINRDQLIKLKAALGATGLSTKNPPLYQVINGILTQVDKLLQQLDILASENAVNITDLSTIDFLTSENESALLPNSRNLLAGTGISFDDSTPNERTVSSSFSIFVDVALEGLGTSGSPLSVKVDGTSIGVNGSNELEVLGTPASSVTFSRGITVSGTITTGFKGVISIPVACTILRWTLMADIPCSIEFDVLMNDPTITYLPATSIVASAPPALSGVDFDDDVVLTGWTTAVTAGNVIGFEVTSITGTPVWVTLQLDFQT